MCVNNLLGHHNWPIWLQIILLAVLLWATRALVAHLPLSNITRIVNFSHNRFLALFACHSQIYLKVVWRTRVNMEHFWPRRLQPTKLMTHKGRVLTHQSVTRSWICPAIYRLVTLEWALWKEVRWDGSAPLTHLVERATILSKASRETTEMSRQKKHRRWCRNWIILPWSSYIYHTRRWLKMCAKHKLAIQSSSYKTRWNKLWRSWQENST